MMRRIACALLFVSTLVVYAQDQTQMRRELRTAILRNDIKEVQSLIEEGVELNKLHAEGVYPLHLAARHGDTNMIDILVKNGARLYVCESSRRNSPLHEAARYGKWAATFYLSERMNPNITNESGIRPLFYAVWSKNMPTVTTLLSHGSKPKYHMVRFFIDHALNKNQLTTLLAFGAPLVLTGVWMNREITGGVYSELNQIINDGLSSLQHVPPHQALRILIGRGYNDTVKTYIDNNADNECKVESLLYSIITENFDIARYVLDNNHIPARSYGKVFSGVAKCGTNSQLETLYRMGNPLMRRTLHHMAGPHDRKGLSSHARKKLRHIKDQKVSEKALYDTQFRDISVFATKGQLE